MNPYIEEKRNSLEKFLKEQIIGPGGCGDRYSLMNATDNSEEVINTTPGSIYSSAILFPIKSNEELQDNDSSGHPGQDNLDHDTTNDDDNENQMDNGSEDSHEDDEDQDSLSRRFPSSIGVSCCLDANGLVNDDDLKIIVSGRYYTKITDVTRLEVKIDAEYKNDIQSLLDDYELTDRFIFNKNTLSLTFPIATDNLGQSKERLREINRDIASKIALRSGHTDPIYTSITNEKYRYLSSYKEKLFHSLTKADISEQNRRSNREKISEIEKYETLLSYIEDLISICDKRNFGYWSAHNFEKEINLKPLNLFRQQNNGRKIYAPERDECLKNVIEVALNENKDDYLALSLWLQTIKHGDRLYLKILLKNTSTPVKTNTKRYYSIVSELVNRKCFFGIKVDVSSRYLLEYNSHNIYVNEDSEAKNLDFLYRNIKDYGVGHLCSVDWKCDDNGIMHVFSEFLPSVETSDVEPDPRDKFQNGESKEGVILPRPYLTDNSALQFKWLSTFSDTSDGEIVEGLLNFIESYHNWIEKQRCRTDIGQHHKDNAENNLNECQQDYERMKNNVNEFLADNGKMKTFRMMNSAMFMQLWHNNKDNQTMLRNAQSEIEEQFYREADDKIFSNIDHAAWRPFQLAFILLNLDGIFQSKNDPDWSKRNDLTDLVWFPTGGGKTEAYLGLIALTILNRRMTAGNRGNGVTVIMRYTLRLLTTQQFQRALRLIMALEQLRIWNPNDLGTPISIGLYVGESSLPNDRKDLKKETQHWEDREINKIPLARKCPWCGSDLRVQYNNRNRVSFFCSNPHCTFDVTELPVRLCDEDIYENPPTLLFGTVDKFAQLAYKVTTGNSKKADSRRLFGRGDNWDMLTPDLIIQDELHLLLGPLGSAVSMFECAIDTLCSREENGIKVRPKIISSTATTRNTSLQIRALYDRSVSIFPKNGLDYDDSFFSFYKRQKEESVSEWSFVSKRKYIGVMPTGRTQMAMQMRLAAILFVHRAIFEKKHLNDITNPNYIEAADYYYTIISYFNSLKEVGKTDAQFYMEFTKYSRRLFKRVLRYSNMLECLYAYDERLHESELTGRISGNEVINALNRIQTQTWDPSRRLTNTPDDYILATNMISVGLDVSRLNTIIMNSMPRNIAEYIQASSRVARKDKGLVLTLHNPFRSRDVSHFEKFKEFHEKLYYYVEPISITPFSYKSVEKYLPLYIGTIARHLISGLENNSDANEIDINRTKRISDLVENYFSNRLDKTKVLQGLERGLLTDALYKHIVELTAQLLKQWQLKANGQGNLVYVRAPRIYRNNNAQLNLFSSANDYNNAEGDDIWNVPSSLRIVEPEAVLRIKK